MTEPLNIEDIERAWMVGAPGALRATPDPEQGTRVLGESAQHVWALLCEVRRLRGWRTDEWMRAAESDRSIAQNVGGYEDDDVVEEAVGRLVETHVPALIAEVKRLGVALADAESNRPSSAERERAFQIVESELRAIGGLQLSDGDWDMGGKVVWDGDEDRGLLEAFDLWAATSDEPDEPNDDSDP